MASLTDLLKQETGLRARLEKCINNGKKTPLARRTFGFFHTKSADLRQIWDQYSAVDLEISTLLLDSQESHEYITEDHYSNTEFKFSEYIGELMECSHKLTDQTNNQETSNAIQTTIIQQEAALPRISLPKFNGDYDCWRSFHDLFNSLVHENTRLNPVQKLHHLKTCLVGDAERFLRHTPITNQDYEPAWAKLKQRFENKGILVNHQLKTLVNQSKLNTETVRGPKSLIDTTEECLQQLMGLETCSWDALIIYLLTQKLPFHALTLWEEEQGPTQELPRYSQFKTFLDTRLKILESIADTISSKPGDSYRPVKENTASYHNG